MARARRVFLACWEDGFSASDALTAVWRGKIGQQAPAFGWTPETLWKAIGHPTLREWQAAAQAARETKNAMPEWWGSSFDRWAGTAAPGVPVSYRRAVGWAALSALIGSHVYTPLGPAALSVALLGSSSGVREDARRLGGALELPIETAALSDRRLAFERLAANEPDDVTSPEALRERQGPLDHSRDPELARLSAVALDGLERAQATAGGPLVVRSSDDALNSLTAYKTDLARQMRAPGSSTMDELLSGSARLLRCMAVLVAVSAGEAVVSAEHQAIAIHAAQESIEQQVRFLETRRLAGG